MLIKCFEVYYQMGFLTPLFSHQSCYFSFIPSLCHFYFSLSSPQQLSLSTNPQKQNSVTKNPLQKLFFPPSPCGDKHSSLCCSSTAVLFVALLLDFLTVPLAKAAFRILHPNIGRVALYRQRHVGHFNENISYLLI